MLSETYVLHLRKRAANQKPYPPYATLLEKALSRFPARLAELREARVLPEYLTVRSRAARDLELAMVAKGSSPETAEETAREGLLADLAALEARELDQPPSA